jgi:GNAT superfamily N-acetyltransferase
MVLMNSEIQSAVRVQLAIDLNCSPDDFTGEGFVFCEARDNPGRRFPFDTRHFEMATMGGAVVVSATPDILSYVLEQLEGKSREDAFTMPFVHGLSPYRYFLPEGERELPMPEGFAIRIVEREDMASLYATTEGFFNAISYNLDHPLPDVLAMAAMIDGVVAGVAGCGVNGEMMWQVGIDVLPQYRGLGIATALVSRLTQEILRRGKVPYYGVAPSNVASQRVAYRAGYRPAWTCVYRGRFDGVATYPTSETLSKL